MWRIAGIGIGLCLVAAILWRFTVVSRKPVESSLPAPVVSQGPILTPFQNEVLNDLNRQIAANIQYQDGYFPDGDPPPNEGVCTDVVIQAYRAAGVDLKYLVPVDIKRHRHDYNIHIPDRNIDYRRVRNLWVFFDHEAKRLPVKGPNADWEPADVVVWSTDGSGKPDHIGLIDDRIDPLGDPMVVHHIPGCTVAEMDWLHQYPILYHFRWPYQAIKPKPNTLVLARTKNLIASR